MQLSRPLWMMMVIIDDVCVVLRALYECYPERDQEWGGLQSDPLQRRQRVGTPRFTYDHVTLNNLWIDLKAKQSKQIRGRRYLQIFNRMQKN